MKNKSGFTLIELLVVISIIGLLASVVLVSLNSARAKSRDAQRKATLRQLKTALELYYDSNNNQYPNTGSVWYSSEIGDLNPNGPGNNGVWIPSLAPTFVGSLPKDPLGGTSVLAPCTVDGYKRSYHYRSDGNDYKLVANCSPEGPASPSDIFYDPNRPTHAWMICSGNSTVCSTW